MFQEYAAEFAFNDGANDGYWRFQLRSTRTGRWVKMGGNAYFEYTVPGDKKIHRAYGTFQGNIRRGASIIRIGEGEALPPGDYEVDSRFVEPVKAVLKDNNAAPAAAKNDTVDAPKKIDESVGQEADARQVVASTVGDLEVGDIVQQSTEAGLYGRIASVDHSGKTTKLNVEWSDGTAFDMDLPKDQKIRVWNSQNADVPTTNGGLDWANNDDWYQQALDEYDENRAAMNGDSNAPTDFVPGDNLYDLEGYKFDPASGFDTERSPSQIVDFKYRKVVLADINGVKVPFYLSTGHGGKKDVQSRKWYPFFGVDQGTEWLNKGNGKYINDYYGSPELRAQAEWLDKNIGDIMDDTSYPYVRASANDDSSVSDFADLVNADTHPIRLDTEGLGNDKMDTLIKANIADIVNRVRMDPEALQKKADEARARVNAVKQQIEVVDAPKGGEPLTNKQLGALIKLYNNMDSAGPVDEDAKKALFDALQNKDSLTSAKAKELLEADYTEKPKVDYAAEKWGKNVALVDLDTLFKYMHVDRTDPGKQVAGYSDANIEALAKEMKEKGVYGLNQALVLEWDPKGGWAYLVEGNHRLAAAKKAGLTELPVAVYQGMELSGFKRQGIGAPLHLNDSPEFLPDIANPSRFRELENSVVNKKPEIVDAPKSEVKDPNLKPEMDGEDALSVIRDAAAKVAAEDGRFPVARSAEDIEAAAKKQYAGVYETLRTESPYLVNQFLTFDEFWGYAKKSLAAGTTTRYADSVDEIPELMKATNRIYARDVLGVDPDGLITFYRNSINGHADVAKAAAGYASLDKNMAFNYNSDKGNDGANGRYAIKAKPGQVKGLLGYSDAADEHGVVIGPDVTSIPGRVERVGDLNWTPLNPLMDPKLTQTGSGGGSGFRFFSTASTFEFPVLDANPFAKGETDKWSDFYAANGLEKGAIPGKYDELYGEGAFERDFPGSSGVPRYDIARGLFTEKGGQFALDPIKFDGNFPAEGGSMVGKAGDKRDKALKFFEAVQQLSGQRFMNLRGEEKSEPVMVDETKRKTGLFNEYSPERLDQTAESTPLTDLGFEPWEEIVVYRGIPGGAEDAINPGDWVTANEQLARDYAGGGGKVVKMLVKARDLLGDKSSGEGAYTEEMIYRPSEKEVESGGGFVLSPDSDEQSSEAPVTHTFDGKTYTFSPEEIENASHYISRGASGSLDVTDEEGKEFNERMRALTDYLRPGKVSDETIAGQEKLLGYKPGTKIKVGELRHSAPPARFDEIMKNGIRPKITDKVGTERYSQRRFGVFMANDYTSAEAGELADVFRIKVPENELRVDSGYTPYGQNLYIERTIDPSEIEYLGHIPAGTSDESNDFALHDGRGAECTICNPELKEKSPAKSETRKKPGAGGIIGRDKLGNPIYDNNK